MSHAKYTPADHLMLNIDQAMRTLCGRPQTTSRENPAEQVSEEHLNKDSAAETARLMRINHTGEVCAQALYQGQALTAKDPATRKSMQASAAEENDHLAWCESRVKELDGRVSFLNPLWYASSFTLGAVAGAIGDKWSLGFVAETEKQVEEHLESHIQKIPTEDKRSHAILKQMKADEIEHGKKAVAQGGADLPGPIKAGMKLTSQIMTHSVYYL